MSLGYIGEPLPKEWCSPLLTDLATPKQWKTISTKELLSSGYTVYGANGKIGHFDRYTHEYPTIMITCRGATCGNLHISEPFSYINGNAMALDWQPTELVGLRFLYFALKARGLDDTISGSAQPQITGKGLAEVRLPLPPLAEQKVIADKLDTLLAQVENTKARLERIPKILKRFRQSVLAAAVSGRLTREWRANNPFNPEIKLLSEISKDTQVGLVRSANEQNKYPSEHRATPYLKMNNIDNNWGLSVDQLVYVSNNELEWKKYKLEPGDWLFNTRNSTELVGKSCVWKKPGNYLYNNNILRVRLLNGYLTNYLEVWARSPQGRAALDKIKSATTSVAAIYQKQLLKQLIPFPSEKEQISIVLRVDQLFAHADRIEQQVDNALVSVNNLTQAILARAFRGELTEQWRKDNPELISGENSAEAFLEMIKSERAAVKPVKKTRSKRTTV
jgi:type I restriction enzyme S subunit